MALELLQINLIPDAAKKAGSTAVEQFHRTPFMWIAGSLLIVLPVLMAIPMQIRRAQLKRMTTKLAHLQPTFVAVQRLQHELDQLRAQNEALQQLDTGTELWASRLNILSDVTPAGVWFTELTLERDKGLVIQGAAIEQGEAEMVSITRLVQSLKASPGFSSDIQDIQIESIKRVQDGDVELVQFTLTCKFKGAPGA